MDLVTFANAARKLSDRLWKLANLAEAHPVGGSTRKNPLPELLAVALEITREFLALLTNTTNRN